VERVVKEPTSQRQKVYSCALKNAFCLRIDADEFSKESFSSYYDVFKEYNRAITIFFNVNSFKNAASHILKCKDLGTDIQSHGYYHFTYSGYFYNRHNINIAKNFFESLGLKTKGFAAPMGKWNWRLMRALEDEGYTYSSDFSYDYMGLPSFPSSGAKKSGILEIPIFPVAPELFFQAKVYSSQEVLRYYKGAIDEMIRCGLPVIIYAHTSVQYPQVPELLNKLCLYALKELGLSPMNMSKIADTWIKESADKPKIALKSPRLEYMGREVSLPFYKKYRRSLRELLELERLALAKELIFRGLIPGYPHKAAKL
jgi:hypothetical protein